MEASTDRAVYTANRDALIRFAATVVGPADAEDVMIDGVVSAMNGSASRSSCRFLFSSTDGMVQPEKYEIVPCHEGYDSAMHAYGAWFERTYPDLEPIQGFHYRAWNQLSETAPALAAQYLDEYIALEAEA